MANLESNKQKHKLEKDIVCTKTIFLVTQQKQQKKDDLELPGTVVLDLHYPYNLCLTIGN